MKEKIALKDGLALVSAIFARNFESVISEDDFDKMPKTWLFHTKNDENKIGEEFWQKAMTNKNLDLIKDDFDSFNADFDLFNYGVLDKEKLEKLFKEIKFQSPFKNLEPTHASNLFALLSAVLKADKTEQSHIILGLIISEFCIPSVILLAKNLQNKAKSDYYKSLGFFISDYFIYLKEILGLKVNVK